MGGSPKVKAAAERATAPSMTEEEKWRALAKGARGYVAEKIAAGKVPVTNGDLPRLHSFMRQLEEGSTAAGRTAEEGARVQAARKNKGDVLAALEADAAELLAVVQGLRAMGRKEFDTGGPVDAHVLHAIRAGEDLG
jgi:hypothetical protein